MNMSELRLRKAELQDMELLYEWANEEAVRKNSINTHIIEPQEHRDWFMNRLNRNNCDMFIYCAGESPVGQIRLDYKDNCAWISFSIDKAYRGQGHGRHILMLAEEEVRLQKPGIQLMAGVVKKDNIASQKKFEELGYTRKAEEDKDLYLYQKSL